MNRYLYNPEEFKHKYETLYLQPKQTISLPGSYRSLGIPINSNTPKIQNSFQSSFPHQQLAKMEIKNRFIYQGDRNDKRDVTSPILQFENKQGTNFGKYKQQSKSPEKYLNKDIFSNSGKLLTPISANISIEKKSAHIPITIAQPTQLMQPVKYFKKKSLQIVPAGQENRYIISNKNFNQKQTTKYISKQQQIDNEKTNYYILDLIANVSNKSSRIYSHFHQIFKMFNNSLKELKPSTEMKQIFLPQDVSLRNRKTIVFDLDETLIHCTKTAQPPYDIKLTVQKTDGAPTEVGFNIRPYAKQILQNLSKHFQIIVFTASHSFYANSILDYLDPQRKLIHHRLFRQHCQQAKQGCFVKDLRIIPRSLSNMVLIDNSSLSYCFQPQNGIPIISYYQGKYDEELKKLQTYLMKLKNISDVRSINKKTFKTQQYSRFNHAEQAVKELFANNR